MDQRSRNSSGSSGSSRSGSSLLVLGATAAAVALMLLASTAAASAQFAGTPFPSYSQQNMPRTSFSCRGKILGGYYADPETQCQMFHVCVKVAGVGVQDFRFLCPNGTAFDQEAQTCADWGDVDCEQATLYYSSDNFDLYRIGSGFESKRAPADTGLSGGSRAGGAGAGVGAGNGNRNGATGADDEEPTFHLQRAESNDARRSKLTFVAQQQQQQQSQTSTNSDKHFKAAAQFNNHQHQQYQTRPTTTTTAATTTTTTTTAKPATHFVNRYTAEPVRPSTSTSTTTSTTTTTTTTTTQRPYLRTSAKPSVVAEIDDIFKGSHSSNFFNNRHGKDDEYEDVIKTSFKPLASAALSTTTSRNSLTPNANGKSQQRGRGHRGRVHYQPDGQFNQLDGRGAGRLRGTTTTTTTTTAASPTTRRPTTTTTAVPIHQRISNYQKPQQPQQQQQPPKVERFNFQYVETTPGNSHKLRPSEPFPNKQQQQQQQSATGNNYHGNSNSKFNTERSVQTTTKQDPFKVTYHTGTFINKQADNFNFELNRAFESQPHFRPSASATSSTTTTSTTTARPFYIASSSSSTTTTRSPINSFVAFNNNLQAPTANLGDDFIDVFKVKPDASRRQPSNVFNIFGTSSSTTTTTAKPAGSSQFFASGGAAEPTKLQRDNFNNLERTVQQLQNSVNRAFGSEPRTLLSSFSLPPPNPTTYNPHQYTPRATSTTTTTTTTTTTPAPIVTSSPRGFAATISSNSVFNSNSNFNSFSQPQQQQQQHTRFPSRQSANSENYTPSSVKKFSTLVPRDQYNPTTFKPSANQYPGDGGALFLREAQLIASRNTNQQGNSKYLHTINFAPPSTTTTLAPYVFTTTAAPLTTTTTTSRPTTLAPVRLVQTTQRPATTARPTTTPQFNFQPITTSPTTQFPLISVTDDDEDDGQYRPELYEQDFAKNKLKRLREQQQQQKLQQQQQQQQQPQPSNTFASSSNQASSSLRAQQSNNHILHFQQQQQQQQPQPQSSSPALSQPRPFNSNNNALNSAEDELLNTAHSQNIAASRNELQRRTLNAAAQKAAADAAAAAVVQHNQQQQQQKQQPAITPNPQHRNSGAKKAPTIPPKAQVSKANSGKPSSDDKDASYDYAYYDSGNDSPPEKEYSEYGFITEFGRTPAARHNN